MTLKTSWFITALLISACGGSPTKPATIAPESSAGPETATAPEEAAPKTADAKPEAAPEPEAACEKDSDCTIFTDCCSCRAVSAKSPLPPSCEGICGESKCEVKGKTLDNVACVTGKCKLK